MRIAHISDEILYGSHFTCHCRGLLLGRNFLLQRLAHGSRVSLDLHALDISEAAAAFLNLISLLAHKFVGVSAGLLNKSRVRLCGGGRKMFLPPSHIHTSAQYPLHDECADFDSNISRFNSGVVITMIAACAPLESRLFASSAIYQVSFGGGGGGVGEMR